ncbi:hypothetical protein ACIBUR_28720 [Streptomyces anulatus]
MPSTPPGGRSALPRHPRPPAAPRKEPPLKTLAQDDPLVRVLLSFHTMSQRHKAALDPYLDVEGYVAEVDGYQRAHTRRQRTDALEAHEFLGHAMAVLARRYILPEGLAVTVPGADGTSYDLTTGQPDEAAVEAFTSGQCHAFARALSERFGWSMAVLAETECRLDPDLCSFEDTVGGVCACQLSHVVAVRPDGAHVDITGVYLPGTVPFHEDDEVVVVTDAVWSHLTRAPGWRRPAIEIAHTFVDPALAAFGTRTDG